MLFGTYFIYDKFASFFRALLAPKSMQDSINLAKFCRISPDQFKILSLSLVAYRRDLNLNAADFKPQPTRIVLAATRRAILAAHTYRRIFAKFL